MNETYLAEFRNLIRAGAASDDTHEQQLANVGRDVLPMSEGTVEREVSRVDLHLKSLCPILEKYVGPVRKVLDVGCSSGGTTVALALTPMSREAVVIGIDTNPRALRAAECRARCYDFDAARVRFQPVAARSELPFEDDAFDLVVCVSVLEFVNVPRWRYRLAREMVRVTRRGGHVFVAVPNPFRLREYHTRRFLGHIFRREGTPCALGPWELRRMFHRCDAVPLNEYLMQKARERVGRWLPAALSPALPVVANWQKLLFRKVR